MLLLSFFLAPGWRGAALSLLSAAAAAAASEVNKRECVVALFIALSSLSTHRHRLLLLLYLVVIRKRASLWLVQLFYITTTIPHYRPFFFTFNNDCWHPGWWCQDTRTFWCLKAKYYIPKYTRPLYVSSQQLQETHTQYTIYSTLSLSLCIIYLFFHPLALFFLLLSLSTFALLLKTHTHNQLAMLSPHRHGIYVCVSHSLPPLTQRVCSVCDVTRERQFAPFHLNILIDKIWFLVSNNILSHCPLFVFCFCFTLM